MKRGLRDVKGVIELPKKPRQGDLLRLARQIKQANLHGVLERLTTLAEKAAAAPGTDQQHKQLPDVAERLRRSTEAALAQMNPSGVDDFCEALLAAVHISSLVPMDPALQGEVMRELQNLHKSQTAKATRGNQKKSAVLGVVIKAMRDDEHMEPKEIYEELPKRLPKRRRRVSLSTVYRLLGASD
jgi:hypothetical protein